ncbi:MAG TPA: CHAT domain-containing tetratricopeptide repeat protein [Vicinamibacteria bacterium]|jgi:CHAT domain-containing protein/tetratricopeptide (TPR) repeat protein
MKAAAVTAALLVGTIWVRVSQDAPAAPLLEAGKPVVRALSRGEKHLFRIELGAGSYVRIKAQPRGIGVIVTLSRPDGSAVTSIDAAPGSPGPQVLTAIAAAAGPYSLEVRPLEKDPSPGEYEVTVEELRPAGAQDQKLLEAQTLFAEAERARKRGTATSLDEANERYQKALETWRQAGARWWEAHALYGLGDLYVLRSEYAKTSEEAGRLLALAESVGADRLKGRALNLRGFAQRGLGDPAAVESLEEASRIWARLDDVEAEADTASALGTVYMVRGDRQKALESYLRGLALKRALGDKGGEAANLANVGVFYHELGEFQRAREYYEQALAVNRQPGGDPRMEGAVLAALGQAYLSLGETQRALDTALEAVRASREAGDRRWEAGALDRAGRAYDAAGQADKALEHYRLALDLYRSSHDPDGESDLLRVLGRRHFNAGRPKEALELFVQSLSIAQSIGDRQRTMRLLNSVATAERAAGDDAAALRHSEASLALAELLRGSLPDHRLRGSLLALVQTYYDFHIDLLMGMQRRQPDPAILAAAFETNERSRARSFLELLAESGRDLRQGVDPAVRERDRDLEKRLGAAAERQMRASAGPHSPEQLRAISAEIQELTREHDLVEAQIRAAGSPSAAVLQSQPVTLAGVQSEVLDERTLLMEYHLGAEGSYLWAVTRDAVDAYELPKAAEIEAAARRWHELLSGGPLSAAGAAATARGASDEEQRKQAAVLSTMLVAPVAGRLGDRRLLIVADGALQYVPFAALPSPGKLDTPLIVDHEVVSAPSASMAAVLRRQLAGRPPAKKTLAVLADPVFDAGDERVGAPHREVRAAAVTDLTRAAADVGLRDGAISRLPFTRREAKAILSLVPGGERMEALDFAASRATATSPELAQYRYVHFATHGFADSAHPELSGIVLSLVDRNGREQGGFLPASQVSNLKLPAELVVLSGCRTALGKEIRGEGLLGLTRAFMSAGAARVVASLWRVDDAATAELMKTMYERILRDGQRPAQALRSAQIAMWQTRRWGAPYFWAAFVIQGEWN